MEAKKNKQKNKLGCNTKKGYYALIDDGSFSGKPPFVYSIFDSIIIARKEAKEYHFKQKQIIKITEQEFNYIKKIPKCFDVGYYALGETMERKFYF